MNVPKFVYKGSALSRYSFPEGELTELRNKLYKGEAAIWFKEEDSKKAGEEEEDGDGEGDGDEEAEEEEDEDGEDESSHEQDDETPWYDVGEKKAKA